MSESYKVYASQEYVDNKLNDVSDLPEGAKPNQYLVTDSEGDVKWEDKLCWSEEGKVVLCEGVVADWVTANNSDNVRYCFKPGEAPTVGEVYTVWMRTEHGDEGTYEFVCEPSNEFDFWLVLTNSLKLPSDNYYSYNVYYDTREDYRRWVVDIPNSGEARADFRVTGITKTIHPIDKKYLPDTVVDKDYVDDEIAALVNAAPETLDTLGELAEAFQENKEVVDVLNEAIATKYSSSNPPPYPVTSVQGKTGAVNFTTETWTFTLSNGSTVTKKVLLG